MLMSARVGVGRLRPELYTCDQRWSTYAVTIGVVGPTGGYSSLDPVMLYEASGTDNRCLGDRMCAFDVAMKSESDTIVFDAEARVDSSDGADASPYSVVEKHNLLWLIL